MSAVETPDTGTVLHRQSLTSAPNALADQDVVLAQDHPDAHAAYPVSSRPPCTIRA